MAFFCFLILLCLILLWISKLKRENLPKAENIYLHHFHFDNSCFKRGFRVSSIFQLLYLYFIHLCVAIGYRFCGNISFFSSLRNELLGISARRLLTENAVPTIFSSTKPTQKRKTTERGQSCSTEHQLIDDAIQTNVEMELIDKENLLIENSKSCQTEIAMPSVRSISTQTNASDIAMIEENEDLHLSAVKLKSFQIMIFLFAQKKRFFFFFFFFFRRRRRRRRS